MQDDIAPGDRAGSADGRIRPVYGEHVVIGPGGAAAGPDVGRFPQAGDAAQWVLRRYLLTRAVGASILRTLYVAGAGVLVVAVLIWLAGVHWLAVLVGLVAIVLLLIRAALSAVQRRVSGVERMGPAGQRVEALVGQTRRGVRGELRRVGLPSAPWGPALVGLRLLRPRRRAETVRKLAQFDLTQVVPSSTLDELYLLLRNSSRF